jgi:CHASE3 domain sensor protein
MLMQVVEVWTGGLTLLMGILGYIMHEKFQELARLSILLNKTREEVARDNVTQAEVDKVMDHIDQRFNRLEEKIDRLIQTSK